MLGVYAIVLNEIDFIAQWIEYVRSLRPDQIVVVDGGSTDGTVKVLQDQPDITLIENPMPKDFSAQRNIALEALTTEWVLSMDADEVYTLSFESIRRLMDCPPKIIGYSFPTEHLTVRQDDVDPHIRLFRKTPGLIYQNKTHETLFLDGEYLPPHPSNLKEVKGRCIRYEPKTFLIHFGYTKSPEKLRAKAENYMSFEQADGIVISEKNQFAGELCANYVIEATGISGGVRVLFEQVNRLKERGWDVSVLSLEGQPEWFDLKVQVERYKDYWALGKALREKRGAKIASWWKTAPIVADALNGSPGFYMVQDVETSYCETDEEALAVFETYDLPLIPLTNSKWVADQLTRLGKQPHLVGIAVDEKIYRPGNEVADKYRILYNDRSHYLKNRKFFEEAVSLIKNKNVSLVTFGIEPQYRYSLSGGHFMTPSDEQIANLYQESGVLAMTSIHEGFCLPALEAMACGCPVVTTDAHANMEFCIDGETCLVCKTPQEMAENIELIMRDEDLRGRLVAGGLEMAKNYRWDTVIDNLEQSLKEK